MVDRPKELPFALAEAEQGQAQEGRLAQIKTPVPVRFEPVRKKRFPFCFGKPAPVLPGEFQFDPAVDLLPRLAGFWPVKTRSQHRMAFH